MLWYRISMKLGWRQRKFPLGTPIIGPFFKATMPVADYPENWKAKTLEKADNILEGKLTWFHYHNVQGSNPPNWFQNPFDGSVLNRPNKHWTALSDFDLNTGDVKILWEPSRFDWLTDLARGYRITGEEKYLQTINQWLQDWSQHNPKNQGPNWKCGQETAIRVMKLITTAQILNQETTAEASVQRMIYEHLARIEGNINYAMAQDNNHGTSEAAALYIGVAFLIRQNHLAVPANTLHKWKRKGRRYLENRVLKLITAKGTFSQRSVTYHRVVVDTLSWTLIGMERYNEPSFAKPILERLEALGTLQYNMIASLKGEVPNLGSNDGAMFLTCHNSDYRDFRPSTQLFFGALKSQRVFESGAHDEPLFWMYGKAFKTFPKKEIAIPVLTSFDNELVVLNDGPIKAVLKLPNARYRFATCDAFHLDLWYKGENLLCDSGSYSYNAGEETEKFKSVRAHNTIQFGQHEQMPKISRFLYGKWLNVQKIAGPEYKQNKWSWKGDYTDHQNNRHTRLLQWDPKQQQLTITDTLESPKSEKKTLYWHFGQPENNSMVLTVTDGEGKLIQPKATNTSQSLYYMQKSPKTTHAYTTLGNQFITTMQF
ncbi:hypothetical protein GCM10011364_01800 [Mangrovimonas yunxiaonensis]|nr:hypothetical protein GCM10011364_01800 [Mangrovimonas yunxiaonensis]